MAVLANYLGVPLAGYTLEARVGLSPLALFCPISLETKKELKQWLNPSRKHRISYGGIFYPLGMKNSPCSKKWYFCFV
jgi:hypothetical protein